MALNAAARSSAEATTREPRARNALGARPCGYDASERSFTATPGRVPDYAGNGGWFKNSVTDLVPRQRRPGRARRCRSGVDPASIPSPVTFAHQRLAHCERDGEGHCRERVAIGKPHRAGRRRRPGRLRELHERRGSAYLPGTWTNQAVTATFACTDAGGSGVASVSPPRPSDGGRRPGRCRELPDNVGHVAEIIVDRIAIDLYGAGGRAPSPPTPGASGSPAGTKARGSRRPTRAMAVRPPAASRVRHRRRCGNTLSARARAQDGQDRARRIDPEASLQRRACGHGAGQPPVVHLAPRRRWLAEERSQLMQVGRAPPDRSRGPSGRPPGTRRCSPPSNPTGKVTRPGLFLVRMVTSAGSLLLETGPAAARV